MRIAHRIELSVYAALWNCWHGVCEGCKLRNRCGDWWGDSEKSGVDLKKYIKSFQHRFN